jgi:hypothetical protein
MSSSGETPASSSDGETNHGSTQQRQANEQVGVTKKARSWTTSLGTAAAYLALGISVFNFVQANADPQVAIYLPKMVRVLAQPQSSVNSSFVGVIIQPTYALLKGTTKTAVIVDVSLKLSPPNETVRAPTNVAWLQNNDFKKRWRSECPAHFQLRPRTYCRKSEPTTSAASNVCRVRHGQNISRSMELHTY